MREISTSSVSPAFIHNCDAVSDHGAERGASVDLITGELHRLAGLPFAIMPRLR